MPTARRDFSKPLLFDAAPIPLSPDAKAPPPRILLFKTGTNQTLYGPIEVDAASMKSCMDFAAMLRRDCPIDYNHWTEQPPAQPSPDTQEAAGWFGLEATPEGIFAAKPRFMRDFAAEGIYWTPAGARRVMEGGYRYDSPSALVEERADGKIYLKAITSCALTNKPAKIGFSPLLFSKQGKPKMETLILLAQQMTGETEEAKIVEKLQKLNLDYQQERVKTLLLTYADRFHADEQPALLKIGLAAPELLEESLKARKVILSAAPAVAPVAQVFAPVAPLRAQPAQPAPAKANGKPWQEMNFKERHLASNGDPKLYAELERAAAK